MMPSKSSWPILFRLPFRYIHGNGDQTCTPSLPGKVHLKCPLHVSTIIRRDRIGVGHSFFIRYHLSWLKCVHVHRLRKKQKWSIQCTHKGGIWIRWWHLLVFLPLCPVLYSLGGTLIYFMSSQFINTPDLDCWVPSLALSSLRSSPPNGRWVTIFSKETKTKPSTYINAAT